MDTGTITVKETTHEPRTAGPPRNSKGHTATRLREIQTR